MGLLDAIEAKSQTADSMRSGSTGVTAKQLNRNFIGMELDEKYFEMAKQRINKV